MNDIAALAELFPDEDFRFSLTLRRTEPRAYFAPRDATGDTLAERRRWLSESPHRYAAITEEGRPLLKEFSNLCRDWGVLPVQTVNDRSVQHGAMSSENLQHVGRAIEPDVLFLSPDDEGRFRLRAGVLCFPTGWALEEKIGETMDFIHGVVPGLNGALASPIHQFLSKLRPGVAFLRDNWGMAGSPELNLHPSRGVPPPANPVRLERLWLRVEHQALVALPESHGVVFGIRVALHRLDRVAEDRSACRGLVRSLETMPPALIGYKRLDAIYDSLVGQLKASLSI